MDRTPNLDIPYLLPSQAQKHVTHNEALQALDTVVQLAVLDRDLAAPPADPGEGDRHIVAAGASGAWEGHEAEIAVWLDGAWQFFAPGEGWFAWAADESLILVHTGGAWADLGSVLGVYQNLALLGVGTTADANNPLSAKLNNALFTAKYASEGGDGDLRIKANKEAASDTVSYLFQTNFSGRAEFSLIGDDDFRIKVSPDGSSWNDAIVIAKATGEVTFPGTSIAGGGRELLTADRTYYVRTDGDDGNDGLTNDSGGAFLTLQKAIDVAAALNLGIYNVTIQVGAGTYTAGANVSGPWIGAGQVEMVGDTTTPANVLISVSGGHAFEVVDKGRLRVGGFKTQTSGTGFHLVSRRGGSIRVTGNWDFGAAPSGHAPVYASFGALVTIGNFTEGGGAGVNYAISGDADYHFVADDGGLIQMEGGTVTASGPRNFSGAFANAWSGGHVRALSMSYSGTFMGKRHDVSGNATIFCGGVATFFPGNVAGAISAGGQFY